MAKDPYLYPGSKVLINRLGITDKATLETTESELVENRIQELLKSPLSGKFDQLHLEGIHEHLFKDVYFKKGEHAPAFAGAVRIIGIEKKSDTGIDFPRPDGGIDGLKNRLDYAFAELGKDNNLTGMESDPERFATKLAKHSAEIWECHAFRDGNTRTTFLFTESISKAAGYPFREGIDAASEFRNLVANYVRGDRAPYIDQIKSYIAPVRGLSVVQSSTNRIEEQRVAYDYSSANSTNTTTNEGVINKILNGQEVDDKAIEALMRTVTLEQYKQASSRLQSQQENILASLNATEQPDLLKLRDRLAELSSDIKALETQQPNPPLLKTKAFANKMNDWKHRLDIAKAEKTNVNVAIASAERGRTYEIVQKRMLDDSKRQAAIALPKEAATVLSFKQDKELSNLAKKIKSLDRSIESARSSNDDKLLKQHLRTKSGVLSAISNHQGIAERLGQPQIAHIGNAAKSVKQELNLFKSRSLGIE